MKNIMSKKNIKYREYGIIYTQCCLQCVKEGTPYCKMEYDEANICKNFKSLEDLKEQL